MASSIHRYEQKMIRQKLADPGEILIGERDAEILWNRDHPDLPVLENIFTGLNINSLLLARPAEPYGTIIDHLARTLPDAITLKDNETRTFLHDIPVVENFTADAVIERLMGRKCVIVRDRGIVTWGAVSPEQTFVNFSSVLFSCFVKFFADHLSLSAGGRLTEEGTAAFEKAVSHLAPFPEITADLKKGPFRKEEDVYEAVSHAGKPVVRYGLVDSVMGNVSYRFHDTLYISQTGSFLDELEGAIDPCPLDNSSCAGITASSELPTHLKIVRNTPYKAVLHGHPKFAVIMSMVCEKEDKCDFAGRCHLNCPDDRTVADVPIVAGESGTGPRAIVNTVPDAVSRHGAAIVYGHGVFTAGEDDFIKPFSLLWNIEKKCREAYFRRLEMTDHHQKR